MATLPSYEVPSGPYDQIDSGSGWGSGRPSERSSAVYLHPQPDNPRGPSRRLLPDRPGPVSRDRPPGSLTYLRPVPSQEELRDFEDRTEAPQFLPNKGKTSRIPASPTSNFGFVNDPQRFDASWKSMVGVRFVNDRYRYPSWNSDSSGVSTLFPSTVYPSLRDRGSISVSEPSYDNSFYRYPESDVTSNCYDNADTSSFFDERGHGKSEAGRIRPEEDDLPQLPVRPVLPQQQGSNRRDDPSGQPPRADGHHSSGYGTDSREDSMGQQTPFPDINNDDEQSVRGVDRLRKGGRRRLMIIIAIVVCTVVALGVAAGVYIARLNGRLLQDDEDGPTSERLFTNEPLLVRFTLPESSAYQQLVLLKDGVAVSAFNISANDTELTDGRVRIGLKVSNGSLGVTLIVESVGCQDNGRYEIVVKGDGVEERPSWLVSVSDRPHVPVLHVPDTIIEKHTTDNPVCRVSSAGYPPMTLSWLLKKVSGNDVQLGGHVTNVSEDEDSCRSEISSTLNAEGYSGWNNSDLCCQLKESGSGAVYFETCQQLYLVPEDYCGDGEEVKLHPYLPCYTFVTCEGGTVHLHTCPPGDGLCFNVTSRNCSIPAPAVDPEPIPDPYTCSPGHLSPYLPRNDTYPDLCHTFYRCVGTTAVQDACQEGLEFVSGDQNAACALPSTHTYCGIRLSQENVTVQAMADQLGQTGGNVTFRCLVQYVTKLETVTFLHEAAPVAVVNVTDLDNVTSTSLRDGVIATGGMEGEGRKRVMVAVLEVVDVTCEDGGTYVCIAGDGSGYEDRQSSSLNVTRRPDPPSLHLPDYLVEMRTTENPQCESTSMGYNPPATFLWLLRGPTGQEVTLPPSRHNDTVSISHATCNSTGQSVLDAMNYVTWNGSDLCCQLNQTATGDNSVVETCRPLLVFSPVEMTSDEVAEIGKPFVIECLARLVSSGAQVDILHDSQLVASYNASVMSGTTQRSGVTLEGQRDFDDLRVNLTIEEVTCADRGSYTCRAEDGGIVTGTSTVLALTRPPSTPSLTVPEAAEGITALRPSCTVASFGFNPMATLTWVLTTPDGNNQTLSSVTPPVTEDVDTCDSGGWKAYVDPQLYRGWNNSQVCCQLTHPHTGQVMEEQCSQPLLLVPEDYCSDGQSYKVHPYDPCTKWVQCSGTTVFPNCCCPSDTCFNINRNMCE